MMQSLATIFKRTKALAQAPSEETTILRTPQEQLITLTFARDPARVIVRDYPSGNILATPLWPVEAGMGTAIVAAGAIHVFATVAPMAAGASVVHAVLDVDWHLSSPVTVYTAETSFNVCNLGIAATPHLGYVMSLESQALSRQVAFLRSTDLAEWSPTGIQVATGEYLGSPKLWWSQTQGCFFLTYLRLANGVYFTDVMRVPADLSAFETFTGNAALEPGTVLLYPDGGGEDYNASDLTLAELDGVTYGVYFDGDQTAYPNLRTLLYRGSMESIWQAFWPLPPASSAQNRIPQMTAATTYGVTVSASSQHASNLFLPWHAADRILTSFWHSDQTPYPHWWRVDFPTPATIRRFTITPRAGFPAQAPRDFTFEGFVNGTWSVLAPFTNVGSYGNGLPSSFMVDASTACTALRLNITANVEGSLNLSLGDVAFFVE